MRMQNVYIDRDCTVEEAEMAVFEAIELMNVEKKNKHIFREYMFQHQTYSMINMFVPNDIVLPKQKHFLDIQINDAETEIYITIDFKKVATVNKEVSIYKEEKLKRSIWAINRLQKYEIALYFENPEAYGINPEFFASHKAITDKQFKFADKLADIINILGKNKDKNIEKITKILEAQGKLLELIEKEHSRYLKHTSR